MPPTSESSKTDRMTGTWVVIVVAKWPLVPRVLGPYSELRAATDEMYRQERELRQSGAPDPEWAVWIAEVETP